MTSVQMPQLGETIVEGTILKWLKQEGERIEVDEPLFELSTDKVDTEVPSSVAGVITKILVPEGTTVAVGTALAEVDSGDGASGGDASGASAPADRSAAAQGSVAAERGRRLGSRVRLCRRPCGSRNCGARRCSSACGFVAGQRTSVADPFAARAQAGR